jgi:hypothetical protein
MAAAPASSYLKRVWSQDQNHGHKSVGAKHLDYEKQ